jgi:lipopolysaccharide transport system permease protein
MTSQAALHFVLAPSRGWIPLQLGRIWEYRELLYFLAWRDVKLRYKQTVLGMVWAILQPVITMLLFSLVFGYLGRLPSDGIPYPVFAYTALVPWQLFAHAVSASGNSLVTNNALITKVYFPRLILPLSALLVGLVDFGVSFLVLLGLMYSYGVVPTLGSIAVPVFVLLAMSAALGVGVWLAALNVQYRDVQFAIPFLLQCWLFVTPIAYSSRLIPEAWRAWYGLNPMVGVVEGFRWALLGHGKPLASSIVVSAVVTGVLLITAFIYFRRVEKTFADVV